MKNFLIALAILAPLSYGQQGEAERGAPPANDQAKKTLTVVARRLECFNWDPQQKELTWFVSVWDLESDMSKPADMERYVIHVNSGVMESNGELRRFQVPEADLQILMNILSSYTMRSTIWWGRAEAGDAGNPPGLSPDSSGSPKDKTGGDGQDAKPKASPAGKAVARQAPPVSPRSGVSPLATIR